MKYVLLVLLTSCAGTLADKTEDCMTRHLKVLTRNGQQVDEKVHERIADVCREIHGGRP